ncbi:MAG: glycosyltransferase family 4 protein [Oceanococcus sp.]
MHVSEATVGGVATYLNELVRLQITRFGADSVVLLVAEQELENLAIDVRQMARIHLYERSGRDFGSLWRLFRAFSQLQTDFEPHVIHAHSTFAGAIARLGRAAAPIVYSPHGWAFDMEQQASLRLIYRGVERLLLYRTAAVVNVSFFERRSALKVGLPAEKLKVVRTGIDKQRVGSVVSKSNPGPMQLLFVGRFDTEKGAGWLLDVFRTLPIGKFQLTLVGEFVRQPAKAWDIPSGVRVLSWQAESAMDELYDDADCVIVPSRWEAFGLVAVEAMRRSRPVMVSDRGALPELLEGSQAGWVFPLDKPEALRALLLDVSFEELHRRGAHALQHFLEKFTSQRMDEQMAKIYSDAA